MPDVAAAVAAQASAADLASTQPPASASSNKSKDSKTASSAQKSTPVKKSNKPETPLAAEAKTNSASTPAAAAASPVASTSASKSNTTTTTTTTAAKKSDKTKIGAAAAIQPINTSAAAATADKTQSLDATLIRPTAAPTSSSDSLAATSTTTTTAAATTQEIDPIDAVLSPLSAEFAGFAQSLQLSRHAAEQSQHAQFKSLHASVAQLQSSLTLESSNRAQSMISLQQWLRETLSREVERIEKPLLEKLDQMNVRLEATQQQLQDVKQQHEKDLALVPQLVEQKLSSLLAELAQLRSELHAESALRADKDTSILTQLNEQKNAQQDQLVASIDAKQQQIVALQQALDAETVSRIKSSELLHEKVVTNHQTLTQRCDVEAQQRLKADKELVDAIARYSIALRDGVSIVNSNSNSK